MNQYDSFFYFMTVQFWSEDIFEFFSFLYRDPCSFIIATPQKKAVTSYVTDRKYQKINTETFGGAQKIK